MKVSRKRVMIYCNVVVVVVDEGRFTNYKFYLGFFSTLSPLSLLKRVRGYSFIALYRISPRTLHINSIFVLFVSSYRSSQLSGSFSR